MSTKNQKNTVEVPEVKMEVKMEVKRTHRTIPQGPRTIVHEQGELTPTGVSELNSPLTPDLTPYYNFYCLNTELCVDLKTILRSDRRAKNNKDYPGLLTRNGREHFTFIETQPTTARRNPQLFKGKYITITRWDDGSLHPNFRPMPANISVEHYAFEVYRELYKALKGLVEE
jgi:hypothetical protein